jgi:succinate dehydrogenase/fumarate reductase flavoprotein subunit
MFRENKKGLGRRDFVKGFAFAAAGATLGVAGCTPNDTGGNAVGDISQVTFDKECDILVVGSGTAAWAAVAALDFGAESVIVLEKNEQAWGGTTAMSGGGMGIPLSYVAKEQGIDDTEDAVLEYYKNASCGRADEEVVKSYIKNGNAFLEWSRDRLNLTWGFPFKAFQDYYEPQPGFLAFGRGSISVTHINGEVNDKIAGGVWSVLKETIESYDNAEIIMGTWATDLIVEGESVIGVQATDSSGQAISIKANKGVVLGTGGFDHNDEMRKDYLPYPLFVTNAIQGNTGDGQIMGMRIGAAVSHMDRSWGLPSFLINGESPQELIDANTIVYDFTGNDWATYRGAPGAIVVNKEGRRFGDEAQTYDVFNRDFGQFSSKIAGFRNIPAYFICDASFTVAYALPGQATKGDPVPSFIAQADSLAGLAEVLGIDAEGLADEVALFNEYARQGTDPVFGRGSKSIDIESSGMFSGMRTDTPNPVLSPLETAPYYGAVYVPGTCGTNGGLKINASAQVVSLDGQVIEGLYAVGNCSSGVSGGAYASGGMTVGSGSVMSYVAARHALGVS